MKNVLLMTPFDVRLGFDLTGVRQILLPPEEIIDALATAARDPDTGVVIVDERLFSKLDEDQQRSLEKRWPGLVAVLPAPGGGIRAEDYALRLVRRAIGYQVRLNL